MTSNPLARTPIDAVDGLPTELLDAIDNPVLVKDDETRYVWVNAAFERLFDVRRQDLVGKLEADVFPADHADHGNSRDLEVLAGGDIDETEETVVDPVLGDRITVTRKRRVTVDGQRFLVGIVHDVTDVVEMNRALSVASRRLSEQAAELTRLASTDSLTGCLNRRALFERIGDFPRDRQIGVIMLDLDRFKSINANYGHEAGDMVLAGFAAVTRKILRSDELLARTGGQEFMVVLLGASLDQTRQLAQRICTATASNPQTVGTANIMISVSAGAVHTPSLEDAPIGELIGEADALVQKAKAGGRNRAVTL